jgi:L,D-transpeptidase YbiS
VSLGFSLDPDHDPDFDEPSRPRRFRVPSLVVRIRKGWLVLGAVLVISLVGLVGVVLLGSGYSYGPPSAARSAPAASGDPARARSELRKIQAELVRLRPQRQYIVVDRTNNRIYLRRSDQIDLTALCSAGSGSVLVDEAGGREWVFDTPRGRFGVLRKITDPAWRKPDWAFVEEGKPVPSNPSDRIEYGVLGEYGLYFGDGYLIHGTLYERLLGRSVSHGCIRVGRDDLREIYRAAQVGTSIYIF